MVVGSACFQAAWGQPPESAVPPQPSPEPARRRPLEAEPTPLPARLRDSPFAFLLADVPAASSPSTRRLASTPPMFGDTFPNQSVSFPSGDAFATADLPLAGASRHVKVAEHNEALPVDRVFLHYHHAHNALNWERFPAAGGPAIAWANAPVDRYTLGLEKTFCDGGWSVELRMPFGNGDLPPVPGLELAGGHVGNLAVILKRRVCENELGAVAAGLAIDTPTGSGVRGRLPPLDVNFALHNDAVHLSPYVGFLSAPSDFFYHGFAQLDLPLNGNRLELQDVGTGSTDSGSLNEQALLYLDLGAGAWLLRRPCAELCTGVAGLVELHYTTALQAADTVPFLDGLSRFGSAANRVDVVNVTVGVHLELGGQTQLRIGGVWPLTAEDDRFFDGELILSAIRRY